MRGDGLDRRELTAVRPAPAPAAAGSRRVRAFAVAAAAVVAAAAIGGCSLILGFDKSSLGPDIDASAVAGSDGGAGQICSALEPNDSLQQPAVVLSGTYAGALCPTATDKDYIAFDVGADQDVHIDLSFNDHGGADDIDLRLYAAATGQMVDTAATTGPAEHIARTLALANQLPAGRYVVEAYQGAAATASPAELPYSITIAVTAPPPPGDASPDAGPPRDANPRATDALTP